VVVAVCWDGGGHGGGGGGGGGDDGEVGGGGDGGGRWLVGVRGTYMAGELRSTQHFN
jgi:polyvinyl alcohol dehydrogenase (cytochrome)